MVLLPLFSLLKFKTTVRTFVFMLLLSFSAFFPIRFDCHLCSNDFVFNYSITKPIYPIIHSIFFLSALFLSLFRFSFNSMFLPILNSIAVSFHCIDILQCGMLRHACSLLRFILNHVKTLESGILWVGFICFSFRSNRKITHSHAFISEYRFRNARTFNNSISIQSW